MAFSWKKEPAIDLLLTECDREPIAVPGRIQAGGFLLMAEAATQTLLSVSANACQVFDRPPNTLLGTVLGTLFDLPTYAWISERCRQQAEQPVLDCRVWRRGQRAFDLTAHRRGRYWLIEGILSSPDDLDQIELDKGITRYITTIASVGDIAAACRCTAKAVQEMTGFDRVMVYRFDPDWNGEIIAEAVQAPCPVRFLGQRFPHTDIPVQARQLYLHNKTRNVIDANSEEIPLLTAANYTGEPVDLTCAHLRGISPLHIQYMRNMGVIASLSISIVYEGTLWGLIACHHERASRRVGLAARQVCHAVADVLAGSIMRINSRTFNEKSLQVNDIARKISQSASIGKNTLADVLLLNAVRMMELFAADGFTLHLRARTYSVGLDFADQRIVPRLLQELRQGILLHHALATLNPDYADAEVCGLLLLSLSSDDSEYIYFTRREIIQEHNWAGDPHAAKLTDPSERLTPRTSFALWHEVVHGHALPFSRLDLDIAQMLRYVLLEYYANERITQTQRQLSYRSRYDALTDVPNRAFFEETLQAELDSTQVLASTLALIVIDLDNFSQVNAVFGHPTGDRLLIEVSRRLRRCLGQQDFIARLGGDEFVIIRRNAKERAPVLALAARLVAEIGEPYALQGLVIHSGCSAGLAFAPDDALTVLELTRHAELALHHAKRQGRSRYALFDRALLDESQSRLLLGDELRAALDNHELLHYCQPIMNVGTGQLAGIELLLRWQHPRLGLLTPDSFQAVAEEQGLFNESDARLLSGISTLLHTLHTVAPTAFISCNLSGWAFRDERLEKVLHSLDTTLPLTQVAFEITESTLIAHPQKAAYLLQQLREYGAQVLIDDFGTGYSSLSYLHRFPVTGIKLDRRVILDMATPKGQQLIRAMLSLAEHLNLSVIAKGIEQAEQSDLLKQWGCLLQQGYFFAQPLPLAELLAYVAHHR